MELDYFIEDIVILQVTDNDIQLLLQTKSNQGRHLKIVEFPCKLNFLDVSKKKSTTSSTSPFYTFFLFQQWSVIMIFRWRQKYI